MSLLSDAAIVFRGVRKVLNSHSEYRLKEYAQWWYNSSLRPLAGNCVDKIESSLNNCINHKTENVNVNKNETTSNKPINKDYFLHNDSNILNGKRTYCTSAAVLNKFDKPTETKKNGLNVSSAKPLSNKFDGPNLSERAKESKVPGSRVGRIANFGSLGAGLALGALSEMTMRSLGMKSNESNKSAFLTDANAERIVETLCRVRGAALKLGQMMSIQDNSLISPNLQKIFERVRQSADFMPLSQMESVLSRELGSDWKSKFLEFDTKPFAAASIGQVHRAILHDGRQVAVKIQYPGVSNSINSDIDNLMSLLNIAQVLPKGMYADTALKVAKKELGWECDYLREADASGKFRSMLIDDLAFYVPEVISELTTKEVLTTELVRGVSLDMLENDDQELRNHVCEKLLELCLKEVFTFRFMQTDPNWSNFLFDHETNRISLIDFGASRGFERRFTDPYIQLIKAASEGDKETVLKMSQKMKFLTGFETKVMEAAHTDAVMILGEAFSSDEPFDFGKQSTAKRIHELIPVMLRHRLTPPPEETYSLHRKMAGCFLLCSKLNAKIVCRPMFQGVFQGYLNEVGGALPDN